MADHVSDMTNYLDEMDAKYPNRHKVIHKVHCQHCPSANSPADPEAQDIKDHVSKEHFIKEYAFVCAWRPSKLCKGVCDFMEVDQQLIDKVHETQRL